MKEIPKNIRSQFGADYVLRFKLTTLRLRETIKESNRVAFDENQNKYPIQEQATLHDIWEYIPCKCKDDCLCRLFDCSGHWMIKKKLTFLDVLPAYLRMFVNKNNHDTLIDLFEKPRLQLPSFSNYTEGAYYALKKLQDNWDSLYGEAVRWDKCLMCIPWSNSFWENQWQFPIRDSVFYSKMYSILLPDLCVPYDDSSRKKIISRFKISLNSSYFEYLEKFRSFTFNLVDKNEITLDIFRQLDAPGEIFPFDENMVELSLDTSSYGTNFVPIQRPLSRVLDKIHYRPTQ